MLHIGSSELVTGQEIGDMGHFMLTRLHALQQGCAQHLHIVRADHGRAGFRGTVLGHNAIHQVHVVKK